MSVFPYLVAVWLFLIGLYGITTSRHLVHAVVSLSVVQTSTYVLLLAIGYRSGGAAPILQNTPPGRVIVDPIVQAVMLTDVVVGVTFTALLLGLAAVSADRTGEADPDRLTDLRG